MRFYIAILILFITLLSSVSFAQTYGYDKEYQKQLKESGVEITDKQKEIALKCGRISGLTWVGVDLFPTEDGKTYVVELNGAPGPMSNLNEEDRLEENVKFYKLLIETINKLCK